MTMYGKITWVTAHTWNLIILRWYRYGYDFYMYGAFEFLCNSILINAVMYDITTTP